MVNTDDETSQIEQTSSSLQVAVSLSTSLLWCLMIAGEEVMVVFIVMLVGDPLQANAFGSPKHS